MSPFLLLLIVVFLTGCALGAFVVVVFGIRSEERHMSLHGEPHTIASASTRRFLAHVRHHDDDVAKYAI